MKNAEIRNKDFMRIAIRLAKNGIGKTSPNPAVGAVIVKNSKIVGKGYHKKAGLPHAEINALKQAGKKAKGAEMYVTLEPCSHFGRTPPCADAVIKAGAKKIFIGMKDPNPIVAGKGIQRLEKAGIAVETGILEEECRKINETYVKYITAKTPFVTLKLAATLDGKIAAFTGDSKWISSDASRTYAHRMRAQADAVMVGIETILKDDPELTVRLAKGKNPARIILDSKLRMPLKAKVFDAEKGNVIIATIKNRGQKEQKIKMLNAKGAEVLLLPSRGSKVDLRALMQELGKREITSLLVEGGSTLAASCIKKGIVDKAVFFYAPKLLGKEGLPMIGELGIKKVKDAIHLSKLQCRKIGSDILAEGYYKKQLKSQNLNLKP